MTNFFRTKVAAPAIMVASALGVSGCGMFGGDDNGIKDCPDKYETVSIEVDGAAPVIQAFAELAEASLDDLGTNDDYDMVSDSDYRESGYTPDRVDSARDVVCVSGEKIYLTEEALRIVGQAQSDGYEFDFNKGTAEIPEPTEE